MRTDRPAGGLLLVEIGTEEIPARMIDGGLRDLGRALVAELQSARLLNDPLADPERHLELFGTPRRLAVRVRGVAARQPDSEEVATGPPVKAAYDGGGAPTRAAEGFARAQGVPVASLERIATPKGECVGVRRTVAGRPAPEVLAARLPGVVLSLAFPKMMRWGTGEHRFVRPIHSIVALFDEQVIEFSAAGVGSGRASFGHRLAGKEPVVLKRAGEYAEALLARMVIASPAERRATIERLLQEGARAAGGRVAAPAGSGGEEGGDPDLVSEVTHLVEWPLVIAGQFDAAALDLPPEIPITAMRHHQRFFALRDAEGRLLSRFLAVANCREDPAGAIRRGNEWVLRARLADARFFWEEDRRTPLADFALRLERVTFHEKLGSYAAKTLRVAGLAEALVPIVAAAGRPAEARAVADAARLCKADLTTLMVQEFPELEGIVGGLYARADGLTQEVAGAIYDHYLPRGADDPLPKSMEGAVVSLADRLDTQAGIFLLGIVPTGSRDPYGMRRSVQGACRILIEKELPVSLSRAVDRALAGYRDGGFPGEVPPEEARAALLEFYRARQQHLAESAGRRVDSVRAALAASSDDPYDARLRMAALDAIRGDPGFGALATAHKRIKNILKDRRPAGFDPGRLRDDAEARLHRAYAAAAPAVTAAAARRDHVAALREIARLGPPLDRFFAEVMVMVDDAALRDNRLALLHDIGALFLHVGDFSEIVVEGEGAAPARRGRP